MGAVQPLSAQAANSATSLGQVSITASQNDIFNAGHPVPPLGDGFPVKVTLPAGSAGKAIELSDAAGGVTQGVNQASSSPDGGYDPDLAIDINSYHGISGIIADPGLGGFLAGVFTSDAEPTGAGPARLDYTAATGTITTTQLSYQPALDQLYFIGDGLTGTGTGAGQQQQFIVPAGATTLWLGVADAGYYQGDPIPTTGNTGGFTATLSLAPANDSEGSGVVTTAARGPITDSTLPYDLPIHLDLANVTCPGTVQLALDPSTQVGRGVSQSFSVCGAGDTPPTSLDVNMPVFDSSGSSATPSATVSLTAQVGSGAIYSTSVHMPPAPVWVGLGDSFSSGHHQNNDRPGCFYLGSACGVVQNSPSFSWVTQAAAQVNSELHVPAAWAMVPYVEAKSGTSTNYMRTKGDPQARVDLAGHVGSINNSWDVLSVNGGADDGSYTFINALESYYTTAQLTANLRFGSPLPPWQATHSTTPGCPDTNSVYSTAKRLAVQHPLTAAVNLGRNPGIAANVQWVVDDLISYDPALRVVVMGYPFVPTTPSCGNDYQPRHGSVFRGACSATDMLDVPLLGGTGPDGVQYDGIRSPDGAGDSSRIIPLDLRPSDGTCDGSGGTISSNSADIQETRLFGFPHPTALGQSKIGNAAASAYLGFVDTPAP